MFGLSCNKDHHLPKGISPGVQARESLGGKPSPRGRGCIHDPGVLILRGVILLGHSNRSRCFSGALLDLALASLGILALGARCLQCGVGGGGGSEGYSSGGIRSMEGASVSDSCWCHACSLCLLPLAPQRCLVSSLYQEWCLSP